MNEPKHMQPKNHQLTIKLGLLAGLVLVCSIATMFVWGVIQDREGRKEAAAETVSEQWSRAQIIAGPVITVPVERTRVTSTGESIVATDELTILPERLSYTSDIQTKLLTRGVYETPVYTTQIEGSGQFDLSEAFAQPSEATRIFWDEAVVSIGITDTRGITEVLELSINDETVAFQPSSKFTALTASGVHAPVVLDPSETTYQFAFSLPLKGSRELSFLPLGEETIVRAQADWNAPSFTGQFLPDVRVLTKSGFTASWQVASYGRNLPQSWFKTETNVTPEELLQNSFGVGLHAPVDFYTMVNRATKYSILFISLTFLTFFMYEVLAGLRIHPLQYLLVGLGIALFYLLLLSLAEVIGFLFAYLISAGAITVLIIGYCISVLKAKGRALAIAVLLLALYSYLYILLQLEELSLLIGSLLLFGVLATVMYATRNIDWYVLGKD